MVATERVSEPRRRGIVDPRLLDYARATRGFIGASVGLGFLAALLIIAQASLLSYVIAGVLGAGKGLGQLRLALAALVLVVLARAAVAWISEVAASRCSALAKRQLRGSLLAHIAALGPGRLGDKRTGEIGVLATRGIDALDGYFSLYLPQLVLAGIIPAAVIVVVLSQDWVSGAIIIVTLPLIPLFMALVGAATRDRTQAELRVLQRLADHFLDVVGGLATLKVFGRAKAQISVIGDVSARYRVAAMSTLRVTFLSSLVLELLATISVALVAVTVGLRLLGGGIDLRRALLVLLLAPEAYLPLRALGANYHASAEGVSAAEQAFEVLETPLPARGSITEIPDPAVCGISVDELTVRYPGRDECALDRISLVVEPGEVLAVTGPSGCGKSTLLSVMLGFIEPDGGSIRIGDTELRDLDPDAWRARVTWVAQRPHLFAATICENIRLGRPDASDEQVWHAAVAAGLREVLAGRPEGLETILSERGVGLSAGERHRVALARAFLRDAPLLLLDEPTANLDGETEQQVLAAVQRLIVGRTVLLVAHRPALSAVADRVVRLGPSPVAV